MGAKRKKVLDGSTPEDLGDDELQAWLDATITGEAMEATRAMSASEEALRLAKEAMAAAEEQREDAHGIVALAVSQHAWIAATKAAHPTTAMWTPVDVAAAAAAWCEWYEKEGCKEAY